MNAKHTPGPWVTADNNKSDRQIKSNEIKAGPLYIATTCAGIEEEDANARLIAAAPDLLEALTALIPMFAQWHEEFPEHIGDKEYPALQQARAAIAKAVQS